MNTKCDKDIQQFIESYTTARDVDELRLNRLFDKVRRTYGFFAVYVLESMPAMYEFRHTYISCDAFSHEVSKTVFVMQKSRYDRYLNRLDKDGFAAFPGRHNPLFFGREKDIYSCANVTDSKVNWTLEIAVDPDFLWEDEHRRLILKLSAAINGYISINYSKQMNKSISRSYISMISRVFFASSLVNLQTGRYTAVHVSPWQTDKILPKGDYDTMMTALGDIVYPDYLQDYLDSCLRKPLYDHFSSGKNVFAFTYRTKRTEGIIWCRITSYLNQRDDRGNPLTAFVLVEDITEQQTKSLKQEQALREALRKAEEGTKAKTRFLFNMSHDIRTPLNAIFGYANLAAQHRSRPEKVKDYMGKIQMAGTTLFELINDVLDMSRIEMGKELVEPVFTDIEENVKTIIMPFEMSLKQKNIDFTLNIDIKHKYIMADAAKVRRIMINILSNAIKYTQNDGKIVYSITEIPCLQPGMATIVTKIADTGIGMSREFLPHLFDIFEREHTTTESGVRGTGLGLAIVKQMIDLLGGDINVESRVGKGTCVTTSFTVPIADEAPRQEKHRPQDVSFNGLTALLAEDNRLNSEIATEILSLMGVKATRVSDGRQCLDAVQKADEPYSFILMDVQMPNMNGYQATNAIRALDDKRKAATPIIAITANAFEQDRRAAAQCGMDGFVPKPFTAKDLSRAITAVLSKK